MSTFSFSNITTTNTPPTSTPISATSKIISYFKSLQTTFLKSIHYNNDPTITANTVVEVNCTIVCLGLDNSGKTTFLHKASTNISVCNMFAPTEKPYYRNFFLNNWETFRGWDLGGHDTVRYLWKDYVELINNAESKSAVLFFIDATDEKRFMEVRDELDALVGNNNNNDDDDSRTIDGKIPIVILLNKCDLPAARPSDEIIEQICYHHIMERHEEHYYTKYGEEDDEENMSRVQMFRISVLKGEGYQEALEWINSFS